MSMYLEDVPLSVAQERFQAALEKANLWKVLGKEILPLDETLLGRVLAEPVWAKISSPHYHSAAMDGYAVRSEDTHGAQTGTPKVLNVDSNRKEVQDIKNLAEYVDTGDPLPSWANAVIPIENIEALDRNNKPSDDIRHPVAIQIRAAVVPWSHVRSLGEDLVATQLVLPAGHILRPVDLGAIAAAGHNQVSVTRKPRIAILPTGSELVEPGALPKTGEIIEFNSMVLAAQVNSMGAEAQRFSITKDHFDLICSRILGAAKDCDLILINAGSSAGAEDFSAKAISKLGQVLVHGVAVRPGHPVILGFINSEKQLRDSKPPKIPIIGVPGFPVSASLTVDIFLEPIIARWLGRKPNELPTEVAILTRKTTSPAGDEDYIRVVVGKVGDRLLASPLSRGAGVITSLVQADGLMILPRGVQGQEAGSEVKIHMYRSHVQLERTVFCTGSHDITIDLLAQFLAELDRRLISSNVGSVAGLISLSRKESHLAGSHLLDPVSGSYNLPYLRKYLPDVPVRVIALVGREQGLIIAPKNPKRINSLKDLANPDIRFINRQRGAGTRVLLDYQLNLGGINSESIQGYNLEEYTHLGVAAAIASGRADCGLGIAAAAQALNLEFIPLFKERYDLILPREYIQSGLVKPVLDVITRKDFQEAVAALPGYDVSIMGTEIVEA